MDQLQKQLDNEEFQDIGSMSAYKVLETQFQMFIKSRFYLDDEYVDMIRNKFLQYTRTANPESVTSLIQHMELLIVDGERAQHKMQYERRVNKRQIQTTEEKIDTRQQHTEQPEFINEGELTKNAEQCHDICPLPAKLTDDKTTELSNQSLESENTNVLKSRQQSQFLKEKSNEAKVKNDIDVTETINIELEHSVAKLLAENEQLHKEKEHLKQTYKDLFDSIKRTRVQTKNQNDSLMEQLNKKSNENADVLLRLRKKGFANCSLKNELRKLTGNM
ncbi:hypothetical protein Tco_0389192 [Tanacetum coccineum]